MLVLTRKADEQILIGDDIKITLVRIRGNSVRIGIDAPRDVRVMRGELVRREASDASELSVECEEVFAQPDTQDIQRTHSNQPSPIPSDQLQVGPEVLVKPACEGDQSHSIKRAPLSAFVSAT